MQKCLINTFGISFCSLLLANYFKHKTMHKMQAWSKGGGRGGTTPPDFGRSEGAAGSGGAPHYYVPPQIFRLWTMPEMQHFKLKMSFAVSAFGKGQMTSKVILYRITYQKNSLKIEPEVQSGSILHPF